jgi:hypothetical protein
MGPMSPIAKKNEHLQVTSLPLSAFDGFFFEKTTIFLIVGSGETYSNQSRSPAPTHGTLFLGSHEEAQFIFGAFLGKILTGNPDQFNG